ncbi:hypothetical protein C0993_011835 [Termitomyces sp. T159_Od127]|nr:hypothetical protein C0993_011835 [Termitomyces sp. T159_Od127]
MIIAVRKGKLEIVKLLVDKGAVPLADVKDLAGYSLTFLAAKNKHDDVLRYLFEKECGAKITNHWSLLYIAAKRKEGDTVQMLLINDHDVNEKGSIGETVLHCMAQEENVDFDIIKMLIKYADTNAMDYKGYTALHYAVKAGSINFVKFLLKHHADVNIKCSEPILLCAIESGNNNIIKLLLNTGANVTVQNSFAKTVLHFAAKSKNSEIMRNLLTQDQKPEINAMGEVNAF